MIVPMCSNISYGAEGGGGFGLQICSALVRQFCTYRDKCPQCEPEPEHCIPAVRHSTGTVTSDAETNLLFLQVSGSSASLGTRTAERKEGKGGRE